MQPIVDAALSIARKRRARLAGRDASFLMERCAEELGDRLSAVDRHFAEATALFCLTGAAARVLRLSGKVGAVVRIEADEALLDGGPGIVAAPETVPLDPESVDLAVSLLTLHEANDLPGLLVQVRRALRPDGLFLGAMAGAGTLAELRASLLAAETELAGGASPRVLPFAEIRDAGGLLQRAGFALPVADVETVTVRYASMLDLMRDLRAMGAASALLARTRRPTSRRMLERAGEIYAERFADPDGRVRASFSILWLSGWAPHAAQQKPAKRGSGQVPLARALGRGPGK